MKETIKFPIQIADAPDTVRQRLKAFGVGENDLYDSYLLPGFTDVHVHLREPGFSYKETISTGTMAAAVGGFTHIISMPNLDPVPDTPDHLEIQRRIIQSDSCIEVTPLGSITKGEQGEALSDIEAMAPHVAGFSDDGRGLMDDGLMEEAMVRIKLMDSLVVAHCEDERFPRESSEAEYRQLERDLKLVEKTGCRYHMCHISCRESVELIREARKAKLKVSCETAPHYLVLNDEMVEDDGRFKMNPPIKSREDQEALLEALADGTIDAIATDHAPHSADEKNRGFRDSAYGIVGLETAFPVLYTKLVREGIIGLDRLVRLMSDGPRKCFGLPEVEGRYSLWDLGNSYVIDPGIFLSKGNSTPFSGWPVYGKNLITVFDNKAVYIS